jgi:hypothetical protein
MYSVAKYCTQCTLLLYSEHNVQYCDTAHNLQYRYIVHTTYSTATQCTECTLLLQSAQNVQYCYTVHTMYSTAT